MKFLKDITGNLKKKKPTQGFTCLLINFSQLFRLQGDMIRIALKRDRTSTRSLQQQQRRGSIIDDIENHTFFLELKIVSSSKRKFNQLQWKHYSVSRFVKLHFFFFY